MLYPFRLAAEACSLYRFRDEAPAYLMAGMNAAVSVVVEQKTGVLWLPAQAVQVRQGTAYVQEIQVGTRTSQQVEITGGLSEGDQVVLSVTQPSQLQDIQNRLQQRGLTGLPGGGGR